MSKIAYAVFGASSSVGECLLQRFSQAKVNVVAYSRQTVNQESSGYIEWRKPLPIPKLAADELISNWICTAPIWVLPDYFGFIKSSGAKRIVALSSTSLFTKESTPDPDEQAAVRRLAEGERYLKGWAEDNGIEWIILRPTMIYGLGRDMNIVEIARFIHRWGCFPLPGRGVGLRQPIHVMDVAEACFAAITSSAIKSRACNLGGGEVLTYREMVSRIFFALGKKPHLICLPRWCFVLGGRILNFVPGFSQRWSLSMVDRMNRDMVFDNDGINSQLKISQRPFRPELVDMPKP